MDRCLLNIIQLGFGFMLIFTAFQSCSMVQSTVIESLIKETNSTSELGGLSKSSGYIGLAIIYAFFTFGNFFTPPIISKIGPRLGMVFGSLAYVLYLVSFLKLQGWFLYTCSAIMGIGAAFLWPSQGEYVTANSDEKTIGRNAGITWAMLQASLLFGSLFLYFEFQDQDVITDHMRQVIYIAFACICGSGVFVLVFLQNTKAKFGDKESDTAKGVYTVANGTQFEAFNSDIQCVSVKVFHDYDSAGMPQGIQHSGIRFYGKTNESKHMSTPHERRSFVDNFPTFKLLAQRDMQLLSFLFIFVGFELCFYSGVYGTCLSNTKYFSSQANAMLGLSGMFIGLGEITGGTAFGIFGKKTLRYSRMPIIVLGMVSHLSAFILTFLNIPAKAPLAEATYDIAYITPNKPLAMFCAFCLGLADACWHTQIYSILATLVPHNSASAFALFNFFKSLSCAIAFFYSSALLLHWQLLILVVTCVMGSTSFLVVEYKVFHRKRSAVATTSNNKTEEK